MQLIIFQCFQHYKCDPLIKVRWHSDTKDKSLALFSKACMCIYKARMCLFHMNQWIYNVPVPVICIVKSTI